MKYFHSFLFFCLSAGISYPGGFVPHLAAAAIISQVKSSISIFSYVHTFSHLVSLLRVWLPPLPSFYRPALVSPCSFLPLWGFAVLPEYSTVTIDSSKCHGALPQLCMPATKQLPPHDHTHTWSAAPARSYLSPVHPFGSVHTGVC